MNKLLSFILMFALVIGFANATIIASDDFNRANGITIGNGWTEVGSDEQTTIENNSAIITMAFSADAGFKYAYTTSEDPYTISFDISSNGVPTAGGENAFIAGVYQGNTLYGNIIAIQEDTGGVGFYYQNNTLGVGIPATYFAPFQADVVYHIELIIHQSELTMNITVDGQEYASVQIAGYSGITGIDGVGLQTANARNSNYWMIDNFLIQSSSTPPPCTPDWSCSGYSSCMTTDTQECVAVTDLNTCGEAYAGDYSEFTPQSCNYCTSTYEGVDSSCGTNDIFNTTYTYTNSCCADTGLPSDCNIPSDFTTECNYCTISTSSHETACSGGFNTTYYTNDNAEVCCDLTGIPADCVVASNTTNVCETPTPPPITGYVPAHTSANIPQVVVDFGVEYGLQMIGMVGLIAVLGLGIWGFKTLKR